MEYGLVTSLARPGANLTGLTDDAGPEIYAKALELLREAVPGTSRVANLTTTNRCRLAQWERSHGTAPGGLA